MLKFILLLITLSFTHEVLSFPRLSEDLYKGLEFSSAADLTRKEWVGVLVYRINLEKMEYRCMQHKKAKQCYGKQNPEKRTPVEWEDIERFLAEKGVRFRENGELESKASLLNLIVKAAKNRQEASLLLRAFNL